MCHRVVCEPSSLLFSIKDTETVNVRPKNFLPSQVNKGQTLNHHYFLCTIPLLSSQDSQNASHVFQRNEMTNNLLNKCFVRLGSEQDPVNLRHLSTTTMGLNPILCQCHMPCPTWPVLLKPCVGKMVHKNPWNSWTLAIVTWDLRLQLKGKPDCPQSS